MAIVSHKEFKAFFETFFIPVYTLMQRYTGECELSRDFTQEAFVRVFEHRGEFETEENAKEHNDRCGSETDRISLREKIS